MSLFSTLAPVIFVTGIVLAIIVAILLFGIRWIREAREHSVFPRLLELEDRDREAQAALRDLMATLGDPLIDNQTPTEITERIVKMYDLYDNNNRKTLHR
jgi:hypothetical protein